MSGPAVQLASLPDDRDIPATIANLEKRGYFFELKFDGIRAVITKTEKGDIRITNRRQADITHRYPDVVAAFADIPFWGVIDGEIIVADSEGRPDFALAHLRDAQSSAGAIRRMAALSPATFIPFDALEADGLDLRSLPYTQRREHLTRLIPAALVPVASQHGHLMWQFVQDRRLEGLIAKDPTASYRAGRRDGSWVKLKLTHRVSALVGGYSAGNGSRKHLGALYLTLWDPQAKELVSIGSVGSGFSQKQLLAVQADVDSGDPVVVEVEYLEVSAGGQLRMPVFRGIRKDVDPGSCTTDTLV